jgi:hypothetical protein
MTSETGQSTVVADEHLPPPSDLTFREALANLTDAINKVLAALAGAQPK